MFGQTATTPKMKKTDLISFLKLFFPHDNHVGAPKSVENCLKEITAPTSQLRN